MPFNPRDEVVRQAAQLNTLRADLARVRAERDRLAQWIYDPNDSDPDYVIELMKDDSVAVSARVTELLAEHDRKCTPGPTPPRA
jgi:hypothetical protein